MGAGDGGVGRDREGANLRIRSKALQSCDWMNLLFQPPFSPTSPTTHSDNWAQLPFYSAPIGPSWQNQGFWLDRTPVITPFNTGHMNWWYCNCMAGIFKVHLRFGVRISDHQKLKCKLIPNILSLRLWFQDCELVITFLFTLLQCPSMWKSNFPVKIVLPWDWESFNSPAMEAISSSPQSVW